MLEESSFNEISRYYMITTVFDASLRIGLYEVLEDTPKSAEEISERLHCDLDMLQRILDMLSYVGIIIEQSGLYSNTEQSKKMLTDLYRNNKSNLYEYFIKTPITTEDILTALKIPNRDEENANVDLYMEAMEQGNKYAAVRMLRTLGSLGAKRLLDVGCGSGVYSIVFCKHNVTLKVDCIDQQSTMHFLKKNIEKNKLETRITPYVFDVSKDNFTQGNRYDYVLLSNILHFFNQSMRADILKKCKDSLNQDGIIIIADMFYQKNQLYSMLVAMEWLKNSVDFPTQEEMVEELKLLDLEVFHKETIAEAAMAILYIRIKNRMR